MGLGGIWFLSLVGLGCSFPLWVWMAPLDLVGSGGYFSLLSLGGSFFPCGFGRLVFLGGFGRHLCSCGFGWLPFPCGFEWLLSARGFGFFLAPCRFGRLFFPRGFGWLRFPCGFGWLISLVGLDGSFSFVGVGGSFPLWVWVALSLVGLGGPFCFVRHRRGMEEQQQDSNQVPWPPPMKMEDSEFQAKVDPHLGRWIQIQVDPILQKHGKCIGNALVTHPTDQSPQQPKSWLPNRKQVSGGSSRSGVRRGEFGRVCTGVGERISHTCVCARRDF